MKSAEALEYQLKIMKSSAIDDSVNQSVKQLLVHSLPRSATFFISSEIVNLLKISLSALPSLPIANTPAPADMGFCLTESPIVTIENESVRAFSWVRMEQEYVIIFFTIAPNQARVASFWAWPIQDSWDNWMARQTDNSLTTIYVTDKSKPEITTANLNTLRAFLAAFFAFSQQKIAREDQERAPRGLFRRMQKENVSLEPIIRVIKLRASEYMKSDASPRDIDWSCRWIVRPHWRSQYYPASKEHRPLLIPAYVKGPSDKPLKTSKATIFEVSR